MSMMLTIRELTEADAEAYACLRREALRDAPLAFGASPETDFVSSADAVKTQLRSGFIILGAFDGEMLIAAAGLLRGRHAKSAHKVDVWGVYVSPEHRRHGVGRQLLDTLMFRARMMPGVSVVRVSVTSAAPAARRLYELAGFELWGTEPDALRHEGTSVDEYHLARRFAPGRISSQAADEENSYRSFRIVVRPSAETNDHEVRLFGDDADLVNLFSMGVEMIGLDPDSILTSASQLHATEKPHTAMIARCTCGQIGCGNVCVDVSRSGGMVEWTSSADARPKIIARFPAESYDRELQRAIDDKSWETPDRTAARLLSECIDAAALARHGLTFEWASALLRPDTFTVSLRLDPGPYQILLHIPGGDDPPELLATRAAAVLREEPGVWKDVEWAPLMPGLPPPPIG